MGYFYSLLGILFGFVCLFLTLLILIQKGRGGGLSSAFGGAGGNTAFGSKTGDVLTWVTAVVFGIFLLLSMGMVWTGDALVADANRTATNTADSLGEDAEADGVGNALDADDGGASPLEDGSGAGALGRPAAPAEDVGDSSAPASTATTPGE